MRHMSPQISLPAVLPFDTLTAEELESKVRASLAHAQAEVEAIEAIHAEAGAGSLRYDHVLGRLDAATEPLELWSSVLGHLESTVGSPSLREAYGRVQPEVGAFYTSLILRPALYAAVKAIDLAALANKPEELRHTQKTRDEFKRQGAELGDSDKRALEAIDKELTEITIRFSQNVVDATGAYELHVADLSRLAGLPEGALSVAKKKAEAAGKEGSILTLSAPCVQPVLAYVHDRALRKELSTAFNTRATEGSTSNRDLLARILELRDAKARVLGYADFGALVLEDRMAGTPARAHDFVTRLAEQARPAFVAENAALLAHAQTTEGPSFALEPWDVGYYAESLRKAQYDMDDEALRPYFELSRVLGGVFSLIERLYGMSVRKAALPAWAPGVDSYELLEHGEVVGAFYTDFFPREGKRDGAWMQGLIDGIPGERVSVGLVAGNMTPPNEQGHSLLTHREVQTVFHEFGHLLHHLLCTVRVRSLAGTRVAWDFVELPSQIMENWSWRPEFLAEFAKHVNTGESIPESLLGRMSASRTFRSANHLMRQLGFSTLDLTLHARTASAGPRDIVAEARGLMAPFAAAPLPANYAMIASFSHLFSSPVGYASGYYSYQWAEALDADAFTVFEREGVFSREVGMRFRTQLLSRGDAAAPDALYKQFVGRDVDPSAMLRRLGLTA